MSDKVVTVRRLKWSFAKFIFCILMFFFTLPLITIPLIANDQFLPDLRYYSLVTVCLSFIFTATFFGCDFLGDCLSYRRQRDDQ